VSALHREKVTLHYRAPKFPKGRIVFEESKGKSYWPLVLSVAGVTGFAGLFYWLFLAKKPPRSMPTLLPMSAKNFVGKLKPAVEAAGAFSTPTKILVITHAAYESGFGRSTAWTVNNPFNLTALSGPFLPGKDEQCTPDNVCTPIDQKWASFPNLESGVKGYLKFIQNPRYTDAYTRLLSGDLTFLDSLYRGGYFTQPLDIYKRNFQSTMSRVKDTFVSSALVS